MRFLLVFAFTFTLFLNNSLAQDYSQYKIADPKTQSDKDQNLIIDYATKKGLILKKTASGIFYKIEGKDSGVHPTAKDRVTCHYKGTLLNGDVFDSSFDRGEPFEFSLGGVVVGWKQAIPMLSKGQKGLFIIPSNLAYGNRQRGSIPQNSVLVFEIELLDINAPKAKPIKSFNQRSLDDEFIKDSLAKAGKPFIALSSGGFLVIEDKGTGEPIGKEDQVITELSMFQVGSTKGPQKKNVTLDLKRDVFMKEVAGQLNYGAKCKVFVSKIALTKQEPPRQLPFSNSVLIIGLNFQKKFDPALLKVEQDAAIQAYIKEKGLAMEKTESGIYYSILRKGNGVKPTSTSTVKTHYEGTLLNGNKFDSSYDRGEPATFPLGRVIKGWQEGIPLIEVGGEALFIIPSDLAYGANGTPQIPANSPLVFKVELVEIK